MLLEHSSIRKALPTSGIRSSWTAILLLGVIFLFLRLVPIDRQSLWVDEVFSLAIATGHSLEHPVSLAIPSLGDYVEAPGPLASSAYQRYTTHENLPVGPDRVLRAVRLSDTSPPLYYLLLWAWTLVYGTSDFALRLFSLFWAIVSIPFMWSLAREMGGRPATLPALWLFTVSPMCIYYSTEGRMYSMLWFFVLCLIWLSLNLHRRGPRPLLFISWILTGTAGLLTHYFYSFVIGACGLWLLSYPGRLDRKLLFGAAAVISVLISPWYFMLSELQSQWRVTKGWLNVRTGDRWTAVFKIPWSWISPNGAWNKGNEAGIAGTESFALALFVLLIILLAVRLHGRVFSPRRLLFWFWLGSACAGLLAFDLANNTFASLEPRFALSGMPAALLVIALVLGRIRLIWRLVFLILITAVWTPGIYAAVTNPHRNGEPMEQLGAVIDRHTTSSAVVLVHSIPSGVVGMARYVTRPTKMYSWVSPLNQRRVPDDIETLASLYSPLILVKVHAWGPFPDEEWLRTNARLTDEFTISKGTILVFVPVNKAGS